MSKSATTRTIESLHAQLKAEKAAHARTRRELQIEIERVWRLVPSYYINLMGVYPPLRKLLHVLGEAAMLQDPSQGAAYEDTMRTEYTPDGETLTQTERGVLTHNKDRARVKSLSQGLAELHRHLEDRVHRMTYAVPGEVWEYSPPDGECPECGRMIFQTDTGRRKVYCSSGCRKSASRKVSA